ncbi:MAG: alpha/beta hydrolase [Chitinophagaceae bacterium]|nr:alpha/beta hydrolase [Chitinophagaceae bacterium]
MDKKEVEIKGRKIVYRVSGQGAPVIFIHGFGEDGEVWKNQALWLEQQFKLIIPDLPGSGDSDRVDDMSMEGLADVIKIILDKELNGPDSGFTKVCMIGHSMGGYIGLAFAEKYPIMLKAFGLFHSTAYPDSEDKKTARRKGIEFINEHGAFEFLKNSTPNLFSPTTRKENPEIIDLQINSLSNFSSEALVSYYEGMIQRTDKTMILRNSTIPILFIAGSADNAVPLEDVLKQCHLPSLSYIHILDNSGHMGMLEEPVKSNFFLERFLQFAVAI